MVPPPSGTANPTQLNESLTEQSAFGASAPDFGAAPLAAASRRGLRSSRARLHAVVERDTLNRRALKSSDLIAGGFAVVMTIALSNALADWADFFTLVLIVPVCSVLGLYDRDSDLLKKTTFDEIPRLLCAAMIVAMTEFVARNALLPASHFVATDQLTFLSITMFAMLTGGRILTRRIVRGITPPERILMIGNDRDSRRLRNAIAATPTLNAEIVGHFSTEESESGLESAAPFSRGEELHMTLTDLQIDRVVIGNGSRKPGEFAELIRSIDDTGTKISLQPQLFGSTRVVPLIEEVGAVKLFSLRQPRLSPTALRLKRATDVTLSAFALLVASPVLLAIAIAIKFDSPGPVFYRQKRIGRNSKSFSILKFRTMRVGAEREKQELEHLNETDGLFKMSEDPRVTRVGRVLRKSSLDELPQLINVFRGEMSLVGPRPLVPEEDCTITGWGRHRNTITPGMTGVWQLLGPVRIPLEEMVELDYEYVNNWTLGADLKILLLTVPHMLGRHGL